MISYNLFFNNEDIMKTARATIGYLRVADGENFRYCYELLNSKIMCILRDNYPMIWPRYIADEILRYTANMIRIEENNSEK